MHCIGGFGSRVVVGGGTLFDAEGIVEIWRIENESICRERSAKIPTGRLWD